jgi:hypothetical protein
MIRVKGIIDPKWYKVGNTSFKAHEVIVEKCGKLSTISCMLAKKPQDNVNRDTVIAEWVEDRFPADRQRKKTQAQSTCAGMTMQDGCREPHPINTR